MDEQTKQSVTSVLDKTIAFVAASEFNRLSRGLSQFQIAMKVESALKELEKLQDGEIPNYSDEWVALFYLTWYQPSHINLTCSIIEATTAFLNDELHVVDFGCGALAMQFGLALAAAGAIKQGLLLSEIRIDSIDTSEPMINIGKRTWEQFKQELDNNPHLAHVRQATSIMDTRTHSSIAVAEWGGDSRVSAIHAVYKNNLPQVQEALNYLVNTHEPSMWFATTHWYNSGLLWNLWDSDNKLYKRQIIPSERHAILDGLCELTRAWRRNLRSRISNVPDAIMKKNGYPIREYLSNEVIWNRSRAVVLRYERQHS